jgi:hypothetical protein
VALVSGGHLPASRRGESEHGLMAVWDWLPTYCALAGVAALDPSAAAASAHSSSHHTLSLSLSLSLCVSQLPVAVTGSCDG